MPQRSYLGNFTAGTGKESSRLKRKIFSVPSSKSYISRYDSLLQNFRVSPHFLPRSIPFAACAKRLTKAELNGVWRLKLFNPSACINRANAFPPHARKRRAGSKELVYRKCKNTQHHPSPYRDIFFLQQVRRIYRILLLKR